MKKHYILALTAVVSALATAKPANAQNENVEKPLVVFLNGYRVEAPVEMPEKNTLVFNKMTKRDYEHNPGLLEIKISQRFNSFSNIIVIDSLFRHSDPSVPDTLKQKMLHRDRNFDGLYLAFSAGVNADWNLNKESAIPSRWGGTTSLTFGYSDYRWGVEVCGSSNTIGGDKERMLGYTSFFFEPYFSPFRDKLGNWRMDTGIMLGTQQTPSEVLMPYGDGNDIHWGAYAIEGVQSCRAAGAFLRMTVIPYMSGWQFGLKLSGYVDRPKANYDLNGINIGTGEVYLNEQNDSVDIHAVLCAQFYLRWTIGRKKDNFKSLGK